MTSAADPALQLAQRLRDLRRKGLAGKRLTQEQLGQAFKVSVPLISSWERSHNPVVPPQHRLEEYATFFATARSVERQPFKVLSQLTDEEQGVRDSLLAELTDLRDKTQGESPAETRPRPFVDNLWRFPADENITIVCSGLPERLRSQLPGADLEDPDYVELYQYSDLDSLFEVHGHIRAMNPESNVYVRSGAKILAPDEYTTHLVLLGGVDWNPITAEVLERINLPIRQQQRPTDVDTGAFEVVENGEVTKTFRPVLRTTDGKQEVLEDIGHFYRSRNPFNRKRTVTMCNGIYSRGVLGAVRALTDARFRDRNNEYVQRRFAQAEAFSILSRVQVLPGSVITPDWTDGIHLLHEWSA